MAYMIQKLAKAHYLCINIECGKEVLTELETGFRFNDAVLRHLTVLQDEAVTAPSIMMKMVEREDSRKSAPVSDRGPSDRGSSDRGPSDRGAPQERQSQEA
jgi:small subunit ribosomal protein S6